MYQRTFTTFNERIGYEVELLRRVHNIKQKDLAKMLNVSQTTLSKIERGKIDMCLGTFRKLFEIFGSVVIYKFFLAHFNINLKEKVKRDFPDVLYKPFMCWVDYLRDLGESIVYKTTYEKDRSRVD